MLGLILVLCVVAPFRIGFNIRSSTFLDVFDTSCDILLTVDIVLNFFTGYVDKNVTQLEIRKVARQYLRFWFWADIASTLPVTGFSKLKPNASSTDGRALEHLPLVLDDEMGAF
ncbi:hypothetical protein BSKO_01792 [Bryopsis sp. KO-2023]|nr:hypothetical protein BSKO_01792 [Bryopsis sp. KO-2023]